MATPEAIATKEACQKVLYWGAGGEYGPFERQTDGWPNAGQVMRYFRDKRGMNAKTFARLYGQKVRPDGKPIVERWVFEMEQENKVPTDITRRRVIAELLQIPPLLLGLAALETLDLTPQAAPSVPAVVHTSTLQQVSFDIGRYQKNTRVILRLYHTSQANDLLHDLKADMRELHDSAGQASGDMLYEVRELLVGDALLASRMMKDQRQNTLAYRYSHHAVQVATSMNDSDLLATSLYNRGCVSLAWGQFGVLEQGRIQIERGKIQSAMHDFENILHLAEAQPDTIHPQLVGHAMIELSRSLSLLARSRRDPLIAKALTLLDEAGDMIEQESIDDLYTRMLVTGTLSSLHLGSYLLSRAHVFNTAGFPGKALNALKQLKQLTQQTYQRDEARNHAWMDIVQAEALLGLEEYGEVTDKAIAALVTCHSIDSLQNIMKIRDIHSRLVASSYGKSADVKELGEMLAEWT
ncbi:MAG: hypothetical protein WCD86_01005 [Ktedonobacteraceae bacterium]